MDPEILINSSPLDFELSELLGEKPADFLVLCFDGVQFERFGTPHDSPQRREVWNALVDGLNNRTKKSDWPGLWENWKTELVKQYGLPGAVGAHDDPRPVASWKVSRVCHGHSSYLHCAIRLFEQLADRILVWNLSKHPDGTGHVEIVSARGETFTEYGADMPVAIGLAVKRLLIAEKPTT